MIKPVYIAIAALVLIAGALYYFRDRLVGEPGYTDV